MPMRDTRLRISRKIHGSTANANIIPRVPTVKVRQVFPIFQKSILISPI